ncbi:hypothetical protein Nepgr_005081 [Nepenthes gracilis]|uniref:Phosphoglycerate mutase-like protein 1 n=1 Tax=Nepenthes gracilis TaxID=150966 RepID=A0AAD3S2T6_NEPGR|nr:hypothetical protein Nepgr_005081 [Nepenthes gracilis]
MGPPPDPPKTNFRSVSRRFLLSTAAVFDMDSTAGLGLYPLNRCKTLHMVRHAQGFHNVAGENDCKEHLPYDLFDPSLTQLGWEQVDNFRNHVHASGLSKRIELVITSPMTRTMQTAVGAFGGEGYIDGVDVTPLMVENACDSGRPAASSLNCPPFIAVELCREYVGLHLCDKRRSISEYKSLFPAIDFSLIESDEDILWKQEVGETNEEIAARGIKFMKWLWTRKEKEIAVISHSGFLNNTVDQFGNDCHLLVKSEICSHFANCELRSFVLVDRGMIGSDSSSTNYPGKIPYGTDIPCDFAKEKLQGNELKTVRAFNGLI